MSQTLPEMSRQEANWHQHLAGMRAAEKARNQGCNPAAIDAFATATAGPLEIGGFLLQPAGQGTVWTLKRLAKEFRAWADRHGLPSAGEGEENGTREALELGLSTLAFCDSLSCWTALELGDLESLIIRAEKIMWAMPVETFKKLEEHFQTQMQRIRDLTPDDEDAPGKPNGAGGNGTLPAMQTQPGVTD